MNHRIHSAYDGDIDPDDLTPEERSELASIAGIVDDLAHALREAHAPDLTARVMATLPPRRTAVVPATGSRERAFVTWFWRPRQLAFSWRPAYALLAIPLLLLALTTGRDVARDGAVGGAAVANPPTLYVQFRLEAPGAASVELAGSFTNWDSAVPLVETTPGVWSTLVALEPGVHDYAFVIDGRTWVVDPAAPRVEDGFGGMNSRLFLTRPDGHV